MVGLVAAANIAASGDYWDTLGPYLMTGCGILAATIVGAMWKDIVWLKRNLTNVLVQLGIKPEGE